MIELLRDLVWQFVGVLPALIANCSHHHHLLYPTPEEANSFQPCI